MRSTLNVGVVGVGVGVGVGSYVLIPGFHLCPDTKVVAVCDVIQKSAEEEAKKFGIYWKKTECTTETSSLLYPINS